MPRIRSIKPQFWSDPDLARAGSDVRCCFLACISFADDEGRFVDDPREIWHFAFAACKRITAARVDQWMDALAALGKLVRYKGDGGKRCAAIPKWSEHQRPQKAKKSSLPAPSDDLLEAARALREQSLDEAFPADQGAVADESGSSKGRVRERSGTDLEGGLGLGRGVGREKEAPQRARARGNETTKIPEGEDLDFEDDPVSGLSGALKQELHMRLNARLKACFGASDRWYGATIDRWLRDLGAAVQAQNTTIDELESWLARDGIRPDVADMRDPMGWLRRMFAKRSAKARTLAGRGAKRGKPEQRKGGRLKL